MLAASDFGVGLGLRRRMFRQLADNDKSVVDQVDFFELAPENWIGVGGKVLQQFQSYVDRFPIFCHGLSLSLGSPAPLDVGFLRQLKQFLDGIDAKVYSEHLSACGDDGHLYDLMPIPFTEEAVTYVANRIRLIEEILERPFVAEHVSYYAAPGQEMSEIEFINSVLDEADCGLLLDVNNIYVNSVNFEYDPFEFLDSLPTDRIEYIHIAGHSKPAEDLRVDTHGSDVIEPVWDLLRAAYEKCGPLPTLLERDFNFPPLNHLLGEVGRVRAIQSEFLRARPIGN